MDNQKTVYDVDVSFQGRIGRQRKTQFQCLKKENLNTEPTREEAINIAKELLSNNEIKEIHDNKVRVSIIPCYVSETSKARAHSTWGEGTFIMDSAT